MSTVRSSFRLFHCRINSTKMIQRHVQSTTMRQFGIINGGSTSSLYSFRSSTILLLTVSQQRLSQENTRSLSIHLLRKKIPKQQQQQQHHQNLTMSKAVNSKSTNKSVDHATKSTGTGSTKLHDALQQSLLISSSPASSSSSFAGISSASSSSFPSMTTSASKTIQERPSMTTSQLAMEKFGTSTESTGSSASSGSSSSNNNSNSSIYTSIQDRKFKNQQGIINIFLGFSMVILACQNLKSGIEKRRIQQQYTTTKDTLQYTQQTLRQLLFESQSNENSTSTEILQIAKRIVQEELNNVTNDNSNKNRSKNKNNSNNTKNRWFTTESTKNTKSDEISMLLGITKHSEIPLTGSIDNIHNEQEQRIASIIQQQLQAILHDIAFDEIQKESMQVQALAATSQATQQQVPRRSDVATTNNANNSNTSNTVSSLEDMMTIEQLLEHLQNENTNHIDTGSITQNSANETTIENNNNNDNDNSIATKTETNKVVVKKRIFSI